MPARLCFVSKHFSSLLTQNLLRATLVYNDTIYSVPSTTSEPSSTVFIEVETKRTVSVFRVYLNISTKATRNGLAVRIFPATLRTFTNDTALSEHSRGTALYVGISLYTSVYFNLYVPRKRTGRQNSGCSYKSSISFIIVWACAFRTIISNQ